MSVPLAHIAGVGLSISSQQDVKASAISSIAKALLDAGITYAKVGLSIACSLDNGRLRIPTTCFEAFGKQNAPVCTVDSHGALFTTVQCVRGGQIDCAILVGMDTQPAEGRNRESKQVAAITIVLVSDRFMISHSYLKDSAIRVRGCSMGVASQDPQATIVTTLRQAKMNAGDIQMAESQDLASPSANQEKLETLIIGSTVSYSAMAPLKGFGSTGLGGLCGIVWQLRGWTHGPRSRLHNCLQYTSAQNGSAVVVILGRSDEKPAPAYEEVEYLRDGRERLGHNPAEETRDVEWRMEGVKSRAGDRLTGAELSDTSRRGDRAALARL